MKSSDNFSRLPLMEKKPCEEKSEFDLDGAKKVLAKYTKMNLDHLMGLSAVDPKYREYIAKMCSLK